MKTKIIYITDKEDIIIDKNTYEEITEALNKANNQIIEISKKHNIKEIRIRPCKTPNS